MKVQQEYVHECTGTGEVKIEYVNTARMLVDVLSKPLGGTIFHSLV
jgi:hypothetical protein